MALIEDLAIAMLRAEMRNKRTTSAPGAKQSFVSNEPQDISDVFFDMTKSALSNRTPTLENQKWWSWRL